MRISKESAPQNGPQENLDFRTEEEKKTDLRKRIVKEKQGGTFSVDSLSREEKEIYLELLEEEIKDNKDYHGH